nr:MAG TPA: hypothetical protein [Caudoviricetes sp.]
MIYGSGFNLHAVTTSYTLPLSVPNSFSQIFSEFSSS